MKEFGKMYSLPGSHMPCLHTRNLCKCNLSRGVDIIYDFHPRLGTRLLEQTQPQDCCTVPTKSQGKDLI